MYHTSYGSRLNGGLHLNGNGNDSDEEIHVSEEEEDEEEDDEDRQHTNHRRYNPSQHPHLHSNGASAHGKGRQKTQRHGHGTRAAMAALPPINPSTAVPKRSFFTNGFFPNNGRLVVRPQLWDGKPVYDMPYKAPGIVV